MPSGPCALVELSVDSLKHIKHYFIDSVLEGRTNGTRKKDPILPKYCEPKIYIPDCKISFASFPRL